VGSRLLAEAVRNEVERLLGTSSDRPPSAPILVACSGGSDSVALVALLTEAAVGPLVLGHIDHQLQPLAHRKAEAQAVEKTGAHYHWPVIHRAVDGIDQKRNVEEQARRGRYRRLAEIAVEIGAVAIATAHHRDDQIETVLLRLFTGRSLLEPLGIAGGRDLVSQSSPPVRIIRPLLGHTSQELERVCSDENLAFHRDESNRDQRFLRNRIRSQLVPVLQDTFRGYDPLAALLRGTEELEAARVALDRQIPAELAVVKTDRGVRLDRELFCTLPETVQIRALRRELYRISRDTRISLAPVYRFITAPSARRYQQFGGISVAITKEAIVIRHGVVPHGQRGYLFIIDTASTVTVVQDPLNDEITGVSAERRVPARTPAPSLISAGAPVRGGATVKDTVRLYVEPPVILRSPRRGDTLYVRGGEQPLRSLVGGDSGVVIESSSRVICLMAGATALYFYDGVDLRSPATTGNRAELTLNFVCEEQD
jgi:tRNA(Ile)-lysidine synthetase-like protein